MNSQFDLPSPNPELVKVDEYRGGELFPPLEGDQHHFQDSLLAEIKEHEEEHHKAKGVFVTTSPEWLSEEAQRQNRQVRAANSGSIPGSEADLIFAVISRRSKPH